MSVSLPDDVSHGRCRLDQLDFSVCCFDYSLSVGSVYVCLDCCLSFARFIAFSWFASVLPSPLLSRICAVFAFDDAAGWASVPYLRPKT